MDAFVINDITLQSRLMMGTAGYPSPHILLNAIAAAKPGLITVSLRRESKAGKGQKFWDLVQQSGVPVLPNTAGCYSVNEAVTTAEMAREVFQTNWIKLEILGDDYTLQPDPYGLVEAAKILNKKGFTVFPYMTDDLVCGQKLVDAGCSILMPWGAPIGSGMGLNNIHALSLLRDRFPKQTLVVDAGLGAPSHAAKAMELGYDAVLANTAIAKSVDPVTMACGFAAGVQAGYDGHRAGIIAPQTSARASTPLIDKPLWHQNV